MTQTASPVTVKTLFDDLNWTLVSAGAKTLSLTWDQETSLQAAVRADAEDWEEALRIITRSPGIVRRMLATNLEVTNPPPIASPKIRVTTPLALANLLDSRASSVAIVTMLVFPETSEKIDLLKEALKDAKEEWKQTAPARLGIDAARLDTVFQVPHVPCRACSASKGDGPAPQG